MRTIASTEMERAGFWIRGAASLVDTLILVIVYAVAWYAAALVSNDVGTIFTIADVASIVFSLLYLVFFWSGAGGGRTPGMRVFGVRVVTTDGSPLSVPSAVLRYVGLIVALLPLAIGVLWVAIDAQRQGWHDKIAGSYVVKPR